MPVPILATKLYIPSSHLSIVPRPRLINRLNAGLNGSLILISAPAGYGKTTLVTEWLHSLTSIPSTSGRSKGMLREGEGLRVAWLSLDESDNDPRRFLDYLLAAVKQIQPDVGQSVKTMLLSPEPPPLKIIISALLEVWSALPSNAILALDDYHVITNIIIHDLLNQLLVHMSPALHLVILTRADPPLPLARLRVRNQLTEIRANDLRFTLDEVTAFLSQTMRLSLTSEQVALLEARTEGWIAGLQLAALSMQGHENVEDFVAAFAGSHHYVVDYLVEEALNRQPEKTRDFLLKTSILERMNASLCKALTEVSESQSMLEDLERTNLFVVGLDNERQWYRYHHLFADVLRRYLSAKPSQLIRELHRLASDWHKQNGFITEAFDHALHSGNYSQAISIVEENASQMIGHAELATLLRWVRVLPEEMINQRPWLRIYYAWAFLFSGESEAAETQLQLAEACFSTNKTTVMPEEMQGHITTIRAWITYQKGDLGQAVVLSRRAIELLPKMDPAAGCVIAGILGQGCIAENDFVEAARHYAEAARLSRVSGNIMMEVAAQCALGWLSELMGRLREAKIIYQDAIQLAIRYKSPAAGQAYLVLSNLYREWNELEDARQNVEKSIEYSRAWGHVDALASGFLYLARINHAQNDIATMNLNLNEMENTIRGHTLEPPTLIMLEALRARLMLAQGNLERARQWVDERGLTINDPLNYFNEVEYITLAQIFMTENKLDAARRLLERLRHDIESSSRYGSLIEILALQSVLFDKQGRTDAAITSLKKALELGEPENYVRVFLVLGSPEEKLLKQIKTENASLKNYIHRLLAAFNDVSSYPSAVSASKAHPLIDPLSARELEVLRLVAFGNSNQQIADELVLATGTVKRHLNNIFGKLNVQNRTECVARARELNLL